jgi:predicted nucleic acid-binding protein
LKKTFVDTAFILAVISEKDELHQKSRELVKIYGTLPWMTTDLVLYEVANSLAGNAKPQAQKIISEFLEADGIEIVYASPALFRKGFALYCKYADKTWGLVDCVSFVVMRENGITDALTNDKHFQQAGFNALMRDN